MKEDYNEAYDLAREEFAKRFPGLKSSLRTMMSPPVIDSNFLNHVTMVKLVVNLSTWLKSPDTTPRPFGISFTSPSKRKSKELNIDASFEK